MTDTSHKAASHNLREIASWLPGKGSADSDLLPELDTIVARSRDLSRNHGIAAGAMQTLSDNIVGTGFRLSAKPDYRLLGKTKEWEEEWQAHVESLWRSWSETFECDAAKSLTFQGLTTQVFKSCLINGEALAIPLNAIFVGRFRNSEDSFQPNSDVSKVNRHRQITFNVNNVLEWCGRVAAKA